MFIQEKYGTKEYFRKALIEERKTKKILVSAIDNADNDLLKIIFERLEQTNMLIKIYDHKLRQLMTTGGKGEC